MNSSYYLTESSKNDFNQSEFWLSKMQRLQSYEESRRIIISFSSLIFFIFFLAAFYYFKNRSLIQEKGFWNSLVKNSQNKDNSKQYNFLAESKNTLKFKKRKYKPILSDKDSAGKGGITKNFGFHTLSSYNIFSMDGGQSKVLQKQRELFKKTLSKAKVKIRIIKDSEHSGKQEEAKKASADKTKIPVNYRFKKYTAFRYDFSKFTHMASKKLIGYRYLQKMFAQFSNNFAPPGGQPMVYMDRGGHTTFQSILGQDINVAILLDKNGQVKDVSNTNIPRQQKVANAILEAFENQNFGKVPPEFAKQLEQTGWVIGVTIRIPNLYEMFRR